MSCHAGHDIDCAVQDLKEEDNLDSLALGENELPLVACIKQE